MNALNRYKKPIIAAAVVSILGGGYVYAHTRGGDGPGFGKHGHCAHGERAHRGHGWGRHGARADQHIEGILAFMETELKITDDQQPAWQQFSQTMRELSAERRAFRQARREQHRPAGDMPLVERLDRRLTRAEQRSGHMRKMVDALKTFYANLGPDQQRMIDEFRPGRHF